MSKIFEHDWKAGELRRKNFMKMLKEYEKDQIRIIAQGIMDKELDSDVVRDVDKEIVFTEEEVEQIAEEFAKKLENDYEYLDAISDPLLDKAWEAVDGFILKKYEPYK